MEGEAGTKMKSAEWAKAKFDLPWSELIAKAQDWHYGKEMSSRGEAIEFIKFTIEKIKQTGIYRQMFDQ